MLGLSETRHGLMIVNPNDEYLGRALISYGEFSPREADSLQSYLKTELSYQLYWHMPKMAHFPNFRGNENDVFGDLVSQNLLCIPSERDDAEKIIGPFLSEMEKTQ